MSSDMKILCSGYPQPSFSEIYNDILKRGGDLEFCKINTESDLSKRDFKGSIDDLTIHKIRSEIR